MAIKWVDGEDVGKELNKVGGKNLKMCLHSPNNKLNIATKKMVMKTKLTKISNRAKRYLLLKVFEDVYCNSH